MESDRETAQIEKTEARLEHLTPGSSNSARYNLSEISEHVKNTRTVKLAWSTAEQASADFFVVLTHDPKTSSVRVEEVKFVQRVERAEIRE